jgi:hypothetical protein
MRKKSGGGRKLKIKKKRKSKRCEGDSYAWLDRYLGSIAGILNRGSKSSTIALFFSLTTSRFIVWK